MLELKRYIPTKLHKVENIQTAIPDIAKNKELINEINSSVQNIPTFHKLIHGDSRKTSFLKSKSIHLIITSPPYWNLKKYRDHENQLGDIDDYYSFLDELNKIWKICYDALVPGGRLICVVGDVLLSRRKNNGIHAVMPLHSSIQERCLKIGYSNLNPIIWYKIANINYEVNNGNSFLGKPYEPNAIIKSDIEFILMERKPGGYRKPTLEKRILSIISEDNHKNWFKQIWSDIPGASTKFHPAPYPLELTERLIRMFSFVGDTVFDPFLGTGTTSIAASKWGRNSIGIEVDSSYFEFAINRFNKETNSLFKKVNLITTNIEHENEKS